VGYKYGKAEYDAKLKALITVADVIFSTVARRHLNYINQEDTVYARLVALKKRIAPNDLGRQIDLLDSYSDLQTAPKFQDIEA
jgi:hypothetical protein